MSRGSTTISLTILFALLLVVIPANAYNVAMYGTNTGLDPDLHKDSMVVVQQVPGSASGVLDSSVDQFTQSSVDIIILGGDDTFTPSTAAKIEEAVARGTVLVVAFPSNHLLEATLPASNGGTSLGGKSLELANKGSAESKEVFAGLTTPFELVGAAPDKENSVPRNGAVTLLNFEDGMPALVYIKYGNGYVIQWTTAPMPAYMDAQTADTIVYRLITRLRPPAAVTTTPIPTTTATAIVTSSVTTQSPALTTTIPQITTTEVSATPTSAPAAISGDVEVYSSPPGASILIDDVYYGTTPTKLTGIEQGKHVLRLTMSGYTDFVDSLDVVAGQTRKGYGTLQPLNPVTAAATAIPIIIPVVTAEPTQTTAKGILDNPSIIVAIIGVLTACIAAVATIFPHIKPPNPPTPPKQE